MTTTRMILANCNPLLVVAYQTCDVCGDDIGVHEWIDFDVPSDTIIACDRQD